MPTTAALAAGTPATVLDNEHNLRIGGDTARSSPAAGNSWQAQGAGSGVQLNGPETAHPPEAPHVTPVPSAEPPPVVRASSAVPAGAGAGWYDQALDVLKQRGVTWHRLETWGDQGEYKFSCSIPKPQNKFISTTYEARGRDPRSAVQAVLDQIDKAR
jgi:hypothetical protein